MSDLSYRIDPVKHRAGLRARLEGTQELGPDLPFEAPRRRPETVVETYRTWSGRVMTRVIQRGIGID